MPDNFISINSQRGICCIHFLFYTTTYILHWLVFVVRSIMQCYAKATQWLGTTQSRSPPKSPDITVLHRQQYWVGSCSNTTMPPAIRSRWSRWSSCWSESQFVHHSSAAAAHGNTIIHKQRKSVKENTTYFESTIQQYYEYADTPVCFTQNPTSTSNLPPATPTTRRDGGACVMCEVRYYVRSTGDEIGILYWLLFTCL